jgi:hypothetical protein
MSKKDCLPKGFLSIKGNPTQNALTMYQVYLSNLPQNWEHKVINMESVVKVREHFGWRLDCGFDVMIKWGIYVSCAKSKTSSKQYVAMAKAYHDARGLIGKGYVLSHIKLSV